MEEFQKRDFKVYPVGGHIKSKSTVPNNYSISIRLLSGQNNFSIDTSSGATIIQDGVQHNVPSGVQSVSGLNDTSDVYIVLKSTDSSDYFKLTSDTIDKIYLNDIGDISSLNKSFYQLTSLTTFDVSNPDVTSNVTVLDSAWYECENMSYFPFINTSNVTSVMASWYKCFSLTEFPLIDTSNITQLYFTWAGCISLNSFPLIDTSNVTGTFQTWAACGFSTFPLIDTSKVSSFVSTWSQCGNLTSFPPINTSNAITINYAWLFCDSIVKFPEINTINATNVGGAWSGCTSLECISGTIDFTSATNLNGTFGGCVSLVSPPPSGTTVRDGDNALSGMWTNPDTCV